MKNDENKLIERRIAEAPAIFRESLERLHRRGFFTDPEIIQRFKDTAERVKAEIAAEEAAELAAVQAAQATAQPAQDLPAPAVPRRSRKVKAARSGVQNHPQNPTGTKADFTGIREPRK